MKKRIRLFLMITISVIILCGCKENNNIIRENDEVVINEKENTQEIENIQEIEDKQGIEHKQETEHKQEKGQIIEESNVMQEKNKEFVYTGEAILTDDIVAKVIKTYLSIENESQLSKLEELPLTEDFFYKCIKGFSYIDGVNEYQEMNVEFWARDEEGNYISFVNLCKGKNPHNNPILGEAEMTVVVEMQIIESQINNIKLEIMPHDDSK